MAHRGNFRFLDAYSWYVPEFPGLLALLLLLLAGGLLGGSVQLAIGKFAGAEIASRYGNLIAYPLMFLPAMLYARFKSLSCRFSRTGVKLDSAHFGEKGALLTALVASLGVLGLGFCADELISLLPRMPKWLEEALNELTEGPLWANFLCVSVFAPVFEEWLCRGMVLRGLLHNRVRPCWAVLISACFFALIHLNPWQAIPAVLFGCLAGYVYVKTGSLRLTMLMHAVNNTFALVCSRLEILQDADYWHDVLHGPVLACLLGGCLLLVALVVLYFRHIPLTKASGNCDLLPEEGI